MPMDTIMVTIAVTATAATGSNEAGDNGGGRIFRNPLQTNLTVDNEK